MVPTNNPFEQLMPTIMELGRERRAQSQKRKQTAQISDVVQRLIHGNVSGEERARLYAQAARSGVALPSAYAFDLVNISGPDYDNIAQELKDGYNARQLSYAQMITSSNRIEGGEPTNEQYKNMYNQSLQLQEQFPGGWQDVKTARKVFDWFGATAGREIYGMGGDDTNLTNWKLEQVKKLVPPGTTILDLRDDSQRLMQLKILGINNVYRHFGYDPSLTAAAMKTVEDRLRAASRRLQQDFEGTMAKYRLGELTDEPSLNAIHKYWDDEEDDVKTELVIDELVKIDEVTLQKLGVKAKVPAHLKPILSGLEKRGLYTKADVQEQIDLIKEYQANRDPYTEPMVFPEGWTLEILVEVLDYLE